MHVPIKKIIIIKMLKSMHYNMVILSAILNEILTTSLVAAPLDRVHNIHGTGSLCI